MTWQRRWVNAVLGLSAGLGGCTSEELGSAGTEGELTGAACPHDSGLTYETFGETFLESYCTSCHTHRLAGAARRGAPSDHSFDALDEVREHAEHIDAHAGAGPSAVNDAMPPKGEPAPTLAERRLLSEWIACGAP